MARVARSMIISVAPTDSTAKRWMKYKLALAMRYSQAALRHVIGSGLQKPIDRIDEQEFSNSANEPKSAFANSNASKPKIILLGPYHFKQPMWSVRASTALPDILEPLTKIAEVHLVTPVPNKMASKDISQLVANKNIYHHMLPASYNLKSTSEKNAILDQLVSVVKPSLVMNTFGVLSAGFDVVSCAKRNGLISVLRVPGDEVEARKKMGNPVSETEHSKASLAITHADNIMVMSEEEERRVVAERKNSAGIFIQIRGVDTTKFCPAKHKSQANKTDLKLGFVGRLTKEKGTDILEAVIKKLVPNSDVSFHLASPEKMKSKADMQNLVWHGYIDHKAMPDFMQKMDLLILPSHMEGRSQTMMEAMACGLPVLLQSKVHPEAFPGMVHCSDHPDTFARAISELAQDRNKLAKLSQEARSSALEHFDRSIWSERKVEKFTQILKGDM